MGHEIDQTMGGRERPTEGTGLCPGCGEPWKAFKQRRSKTKPGSGPVSMAMGASWTGDKRIESGRPEAVVLGSLLLPTALRGGMAQSTGDQEVAGPTLPESSPWVPRDGAEQLPHTLLLFRVGMCHLVPGPQQRVYHPASERDRTGHPPLAEPHTGGGE